MSNNPRYHNAFLDMAKAASTLSKDPSTKVGCIIVRDRDIAMGFNGFPPSVLDDEEVLSNRATLNGLTKYDLMIHAELNAMLNAGFDLVGATLYCTHFPCKECAKHIVAARIHCVVCFGQTGKSDLGYETARQILTRGRVHILEIVDEYFRFP